MKNKPRVEPQTVTTAYTVVASTLKIRQVETCRPQPTVQTRTGCGLRDNPGTARPVQVTTMYLTERCLWLLPDVDFPSCIRESQPIVD